MKADLSLKFLAGAIIATGLAAGPHAASAQGYAGQSCGQLWYARNAIYASAGYCFQTPQAIGAFGRACFAPFGRLTASQQARVNEIQSWERRKGCSG